MPAFGDGLDQGMGQMSGCVPGGGCVKLLERRPHLAEQPQLESPPAQPPATLCPPATCPLRRPHRRAVVGVPHQHLQGPVGHHLGTSTRVGLCLLFTVFPGRGSSGASVQPSPCCSLPSQSREPLWAFSQFLTVCVPTMPLTLRRQPRHGSGDTLGYCGWTWAIIPPTS